MSFGDKLRTLIEERGMTQKEIACKLNIAPSTMSSYVQNKREPDFATLIRIAEYFDVSSDYLLGLDNDRSMSCQESEMLRIFSSLSPEQKSICIEQCRVFLKMNIKETFPRT